MYILRKLVVNHNYHRTKSTTWIEINQVQPTDMTSVEPAEETIRFLREPLECWRRRKK